jgi:hypothetical protein
VPDLIAEVERLRDELEHAHARAEDERGGRRVAGAAADRFRDVVAEVTGHTDKNPGDDVLVSELRSMHGKGGPEPRRWRDFLTGALAQVDQIRADEATS